MLLINKGNIMETNYNRFTVRPYGDQFQVFKLKRERCGGWATDMAACKFRWFVSGAATAKFTGDYTSCIEYIESANGVYMTEHGIAC